MFNCNVFSLSTARTARDVRDTVQDAQKWLAEAWSLCEPDANFGKQASAITPRAKAAWDAIVGFPCDLAGLHDMAQNAAQLRVDLSPSSADVDLSPSSPSDPRGKKRSRRSEQRNNKKSRRARSSGRHNKKRHRTNIEVRRSSPQRAEPDRATLAPQASQSHPDQVDQRPKIERVVKKEEVVKKEQVDEPPTIEPVRLSERPKSPTPPVRRARPWARPKRTVCPCCDGDGYINADIPEFASFELTESSLYSLMRNLNIDTHAIHLAFLLVQRFEQDGLKEVQGVIMNVIKNFEWIANPSAFVSKACINFRKSREPHHLA